MRRLYIFVLVVALLCAMTASAVERGKEPMRNMPIVGGSYEPANVPVTPVQHGPVATLDDPIGTVYDAGTTWYDYQHNGTAGKMIGVDADGFIHMVWMNGTTNVLGGPRQINYQVWDPTSQEMQFLTNGEPSGFQVNSSLRAGYACLDVTPNGFAFPAFHESRTGVTGIHSAAAMDFNARLGAFTTTTPAYCPNPSSPLEYVWPKISISRFDSSVHMASCWSAPAAGTPQPMFYSRGRASWDDQGNGVQIDWDALSCGGYENIDTTMVIADLVVASPHSPRVAYLWVKSRDIPIDSATQYNNDLYYQMSEDGGHNWGPRINITDFAEPDWDCASGDTLVCDRDTNRVYEDCSAIFDQADNLHVAFTTSYYYSLEGLINTWFSDCWHWDTHYDEFSLIYHGQFDSTTWAQAPGAWQRDAQRPSLCVDATTGYLYCSIWVYDSMDVSEGGYPQGEAYVSVSRNCGRTWSQATNVTNTHPTANPTPAGQCLSERDITISDYVSYVDNVGYLNMEYILDLDAGGIAQSEGTATLDHVKYQRIPIDQIPALPLNDWTHNILRFDSTGYPGRVLPLDPEAIVVCGVATDPTHETLRPSSFKLYQNYPNPFNPTTNIQFDLTRDAKVNLTVFNVLGEQVATLFDNKWMPAGVQTANFDASGLSSGVYIYRLEVAGHSEALKMIVMK